ncbi:MAG: prepilin-type N-terminal cleavage/methylation domain-containing protein [Kofleriaceae bacterium]
MSGLETVSSSRPERSEVASTSRGFTLIEVMFALALLGLALVVLIKSASSSIFNAEQAHMMGVATDLGRGEMYEIEEILLKDGFSDTDQSHEDWQDFADQGWPNVKYSYKVEIVEFPSFDQLQALAAGKGMGSGSAGSSALGSAQTLGSDFSLGSNTDPLASFQNSTLGGMMSMMGGMGGGSAKDVAGTMGGAVIQSQYTMFQQILKDSVRKVTLKLKWQVLGYDRDLTFVAFYTDPVAMDRTLSGAGAGDSPDNGGASSGSGTGSGSGSGRGRGSSSSSGLGGGKGG